MAQDRLVRQVAGEGAEGQAVARGEAVKEIRGDDAAGRGHVLHDDGGLAGDMVDHVARQQPRADVVIRAGRMANDHADLLAAVEILDGLRGRGRGGEDGEREQCL